MAPTPEAQSLVLTPTLVVEDDPAVQRRLQRLLITHGLAAETAYIAGSVAEAEQACGNTRFRFALVDIGLPDGSGLRLIEWMSAHHPDITAIVVSAFGTEELIVEALRCGALGYLLKERDDEELLASLRTIERGGAPIDPFVARHILHLVGAGATRPSALSSERVAVVANDPGTNSEETLTPREVEILSLVARGLISREIAQHLTRSPQTIECHIKNIFRKMAVNTRTEAVHQARIRGLLL